MRATANCLKGNDTVAISTTKRICVSGLGLSNFTVFQMADIHFSPSLNVIVGENGAGKTHILKLVYAILAVNSPAPGKAAPTPPAKAQLQTRLADKLTNVFRAESLGRLARRQPGTQRCDVRLSMTHSNMGTDFTFSTRSKSEVTLTRAGAEWLDVSPAYIPTRELLTIYPNFVSLYDRSVVEFDETWRDTCLLLGLPPRRGPRPARVNDLIAPLEQAMGGSIEYDQIGRFYLRTKAGRMEMPLVAEGLRKLGMIAQLVATSALLDNGFLFWDEPEANLNPVLIVKVARTILDLCKLGIQIFIATHSLFLLREFAILIERPEYRDLRPQFISLSPGSEGISIQQGSSLEEIDRLAALDEELTQSERYNELEG